MEQIAQLIQSYLHLRSSVLRKLPQKALCKSDALIATRVTKAKLIIRAKKPETWTINEIRLLAQYYKLSIEWWPQFIRIGHMIASLPYAQKIDLLRRANIDLKKIKLRENDANMWKTHDLQNLLIALNTRTTVESATRSTPDRPAITDQTRAHRAC